MTANYFGLAEDWLRKIPPKGSVCITHRAPVEPVERGGLCQLCRAQARQDKDLEKVYYAITSKGVTR